MKEQPNKSMNPTWENALRFPKRAVCQEEILKTTSIKSFSVQKLIMQIGQALAAKNNIFHSGVKGLEF